MRDNFVEDEKEQLKKDDKKERNTWKPRGRKQYLKKKQDNKRKKSKTWWPGWYWKRTVKKIRERRKESFAS